MAITHTNASPHNLRNTLCNTVVDALDSGTGNPKMLILDNTAQLVSISLQTPAAFGAASGGTASLNGSPSGTASATGTADTFKLQDRNGNDLVTGTVGTTGSDLNLSNVSLSSGDKITITSCSYSAPS